MTRGLMTRGLSNALVVLAVLMIAAPVCAQGRTTWRTSADIVEGVSGSMVGVAIDVNEARNEVVIQADDDRYGQITVVADAVSTQYNGFGDLINGKPEIFTGTRGFSNLRVGDRLEIRGSGRGAGQIRADQVTLLGRSVPASQTGVGGTRSPGSGISTPPVAGSSATVYGRIEGVVRQVNARDNRVVVETDRREIFNIRTTNATPVYYRGDKYEVSNLEQGDRVRIDSDGTTSADREIRARSIEVTESVQEGSGARVSSVSGRVVRIDRTADSARIDTGRGEVRVDMSRAFDASGRRVRAADLQMGDRVEISGNYGSKSDLFVASTVRFSEDVFSPVPEDRTGADRGSRYTPELVTVSIAGTITETLQNSATLSVRERSGRVLPVFATEDFAVRNKNGTFTTADRLNVSDSVLIKAYRDGEGNLIAQTIRMR